MQLLVYNVAPNKLPYVVTACAEAFAPRKVELEGMELPHEDFYRNLRTELAAVNEMVAGINPMACWNSCCPEISMPIFPPGLTCGYGCLSAACDHSGP